MEFGAHGVYQIEQSGEVYILSFSKLWDLEGAQAFFAAYQKVVTRTALERFGVLSDMLLLEGATPDAIAFFDHIAEWATRHGQIARALLLDSGYKEYIVQNIDRRARAYPVRFCADRGEALDWFASLGLATGRS